MMYVVVVLVWTSALLSLHIKPCVEYLWYVTLWYLCLKQEDQLIETTKGQAMVLNIHILWYNRFVFRQWLPSLWEKPGPMHLALMNLMAGWHADKIGMSCKIFKIPYKLNYLDFYFIWWQYNVIIVLVVHFSLLSSSKAYLKACFKSWTIRCHFSTSIPTFRYYNVPNDY